MANNELMMHVANSCPGYLSKNNTFESSMGGPESKSCISCTHYQNEKCKINYFDKVASSLDQS